MLENNEEQLQELEEKLESLTQRLEDLELNPSSFDPFDQYDVERMLEDFRNKEQGLESQVEESEEVEQSVGDDFIQVNTNNSKQSKFEVHWISIDECGPYTDCSEILSNVEAKDALKYAVASRGDPASPTRKIKHGDVLILLCRNTGELPADASEGEEPPKKSCTHIGMYTEYSSRQAPEPDAAEVVEAKISDSNEFGDVFVWSSCAECENLGEAVDILTVGDSDSSSGSGSEESFTFLKSGDDGSPYASDEIGYVTDISVEKANVQSGYTTRGLVIDSNTSSVTAGYYGSLKKLGDKLTNYWVDYNKNKFKVKADVGNINTGAFDFNSNSSILKKPLLSDECGNLRISLYQSESAINLFSGSLSDTSGTFSTFNKNLSVSLGNLELVDMSEVDNALPIPSYDIQVSAIEDDGVGAKSIFFPTISESDAGNIEASAFISFLEEYNLSIEARYTVVYESENKGDAEYYFYETKTKVNDAAFASGLFYDGGNEDPDGTEKTLLGIIRVKDIPLRYGCHETYGCQLDPAGQYYDSACGSGCPVTYDPILTYRPPYVYVYYYNAEYDCYTLKSEHVRDDADERNDISNHYYSNGGRYTAEIIEGKTENIFYVNNVKETDVIRTSPFPEAKICKTLDTVLADFTMQAAGGIEERTVVETFIPTTEDQDIRIRFNPYRQPDEITVWYIKDGQEIELVEAQVLSDEKPNDVFNGGEFHDSIFIYVKGFYWTKTVPAGSTGVKVYIDGTLGGSTAWNFDVSTDLTIPKPDPE